MRDLLSNDVSASSGISWPWKAMNSMSYLNDLLDGDSCKNFFYLYSFSLFSFSNMILSHAFILPIS